MSKHVFDLEHYSNTILERYGEEVHRKYLLSREERPKLFPTANLALVLAPNPEGYGLGAFREPRGCACCAGVQLKYDPNERRPI